MTLMDPAKRPVLTFVAALAAVTLMLSLCSAAMAAAAGRGDIVTVKVRTANAKPRNEAEARVLLRALGNAAQEACGASSFSLPAVRVAVRRSACWHEAMARAVKATDRRMLADLHARAISRHREG